MPKSPPKVGQPNTCTNAKETLLNSKNASRKRLAFWPKPQLRAAHFLGLGTQLYDKRVPMYIAVTGRADAQFPLARPSSSKPSGKPFAI